MQPTEAPQRTRLRPTRLGLVFAILSLALALGWYFQTWKRPAPLADRHSTEVAMERSLLPGLGWLQTALRPGAATTPTESSHSACAPSVQETESAPLACALEKLNHTLAPAGQHVEGTPPAEVQAQVRATVAWLLRHGHNNAARILELIHAPREAVTAASPGMADPFRLPGCLLVGAEPEAGCAQRSATLPQGLQPLLVALHPYRQALRAASPNRVQADGTELVQGRHVRTGPLDAHAASSALARCYTGEKSACDTVCPDCGVAPAFFEQARARAVAILVVDAHTGLIDAATSAHTPCFTGTAPTACPALAPHHLNDLQNLALSVTAPPGSLVKPLVAAALLDKGRLDAVEQQALPGILQSSNSEALIDIVLCRRKGFERACAQRRLEAIQATAKAMGWNGGNADLLTAGQVQGMRYASFTGRMLERPVKTQDFALQALARCASRPDKQRWRQCTGAALADTLAELFGTGNAQASLAGIADIWLQLAASANGNYFAPWPHVASQVQDAAGGWHAVAPNRPLAVGLRSANDTLQYLSRSHTPGGTAHAACLAAQQHAVQTGQPWHIPCATTSKPSIALELAGKTGTPKYPDTLPVGQRAMLCSVVRAQLAETPPHTKAWHHLKNNVDDCALQPWKWYAYALKKPGSSTWDNVVVVLAQRNVERATGFIDNRFDHGSNVAAEIGLTLANQLRGERT